MNKENLIILLPVENNLYMKAKHFSRKMVFFNVLFLPSTKSTSQHDLQQEMADRLTYRNVSIHCNAASSQHFSR